MISNFIFDFSCFNFAPYLRSSLNGSTLAVLVRNANSNNDSRRDGDICTLVKEHPWPSGYGMGLESLGL